MILVNADKVKDSEKKKSMARKMANSLLQKIAHKGGKIGAKAAQLDSFMSRKLDKGKGIY